MYTNLHSRRNSRPIVSPAHSIPLAIGVALIFGAFVASPATQNFRPQHKSKPLSLGQNPLHRHIFLTPQRSFRTSQPSALRYHSEAVLLSQQGAPFSLQHDHATTWAPLLTGLGLLGAFGLLIRGALHPCAKEQVNIASVNWRMTAVALEDTPSITIFTSEGCPYCQRAKGLLGAKGWPYTEINLTVYPEKRADMLAVADRATVPQVFINGVHIGGCDDLFAADASGKLEALYHSETRNTDPRLQKPSYQPQVPLEALPKPQHVFSIQGSSCTYGGLLHKILRSPEHGGLDVQDHWRRFQFYRKCFTGAELVDWIISSFGVLNRSNAVEVAREWFAAEVFHPLLGQAEFQDDTKLYRLQAHEETGALNTIQVWRQPADPPMVVVARLNKMLSEVVAMFRDVEGKVDYLAMHHSEAFMDFQLATCELQVINFKDMTENERKAFCFNVYNMLVLHAYGQIGVPKFILGFFNRIRYNIQGYNYSCEDIENGILRANRRPVVALGPLFRSADPRLEFSLKVVDHRLHFALNCGAKSCPPVKYYTAEKVDDELALSAQAFCEQEENVRIDLEKRTLYLSQILQWYSCDFGQNDAEVAQTVLQHLRGQKQQQLAKLLQGGSFRIRYLPYDWSNDAKTSPPYKFSIFDVFS